MQQMNRIAPILLLVVFAAALLEGIVRSALGRRYDWRSYFSSLGDLVGRHFIGMLAFGIATPVFAWAWEHRAFTVPLDRWWSWVLLFIGEEWCYYWYHRTSHTVRWFWATHAVHHSPNELSFAAELARRSLRLHWTPEAHALLADIVAMTPVPVWKKKPLGRAIADPDTEVWRLPMLRDDERQTLLGSWSCGDPARSPDRSVAELVAERALEAPHSLAVSEPDRELTYGDLDARASQLALRLGHMGVGPEDVVGVFAPGGADFVIGILGILKAGAAFLPLDLQAPSARHWFGTDQLGRDILSRVVVAARLDMAIAMSSVALVFAVGGLAGIAAGFFGGSTDRIVGRIADTIMAFPLFVLAMGIVAALGNTVENVVLATAIVNFPLYARIARAEANVRREAGFVLAARLSGNGELRILLGHILPNIMPIMVVQMSLTMGYAILNAAGLSFIGLGVRPPTAEWGIMVAEGAAFMVSGEWWIAFFPGAALMVAVFCFNLLGDGLRDIVDPQRRT